jgi:uncharacterized Zn finger protein
VSPSDYVETKATRLLREGRVLVYCTEENGIEARVQGDHDSYGLFLEPTGWRCTCPSRKTCSHARVT